MYDRIVDHKFQNISSLGFNNSSVGIPEDYRFTTLEHTLIDVLIAAHAKSFKAAMFSSLSDLVSIFANIGRKDLGWC